MNASAPVLSIDALSGGHADITVIHRFSAAVAPGELAFVTGRNGVGKSTLVKLVGRAPAGGGRGRLTFRGEDLTAAPGHRRRHLGLGYAPQEGIVFDELTVAENLTLQYANRSLDRYEALFARFPFLAERLPQRAGTLSGGQKKILSFCRALAEDTALVILDEPTEGVQAENIAPDGRGHPGGGGGRRARLPRRRAEPQPRRGGGRSGLPARSGRVRIRRTERPGPSRRPPRPAPDLIPISGSSPEKFTDVRREGRQDAAVVGRTDRKTLKA